MLEKLLDEATVAMRAEDEQRVEHLISQLAQSSDERVIDVVMEAFRRPEKLRQLVAIRVLQLLGYPTNEPAIPELIYHLVDPNSPGWKEVVKMFVDIGSEIVVPYLIQALLDQEACHRVGEKNVPIWAGNVEGIGYFLTDKIVGQEYVDACIPAIVFLLSQETRPEGPDIDLLLDVIEKARSLEEYMLPVLITFAKKHDALYIREHADALISAFRQDILAPYKRAITP